MAHPIDVDLVIAFEFERESPPGFRNIATMLDNCSNPYVPRNDDEIEGIKRWLLIPKPIKCTKINLILEQVLRFLPKKLLDSGWFPSSYVHEGHLQWRVSFSNQEKYILQQNGRSKAIIRQVKVRLFD